MPPQPIPEWEVSRGPKLGEDVVKYAEEQAGEAISLSVLGGSLELEWSGKWKGPADARPPRVTFRIAEETDTDPSLTVTLADLIEEEIWGNLPPMREQGAGELSSAAAIRLGVRIVLTEHSAGLREVRDVLRHYADALDLLLPPVD